MSQTGVFQDQASRPPKIWFKAGSSIRILWLLLGLTLFLFSIIYIRVNIAGMYVAVPMVAVGIVAGLGLLMVLSRGGRVSRPFFSKYGFLIAAFVGFVAAHALALLYGLAQGAYGDSFGSGEDNPYKILTKIIMGASSFWAIVRFFPRNQKFLERFWRATLTASVIFFAWLIYQFAFVYKNDFLNANFEHPDERGVRNMLAFYATVIFPYAFFYFYWAKKRLTGGAAVIVLAVAIIYATSRTAWIGTILALIAAICFIARLNIAKGLKMAFSSVVVIGLAVAGGWWFLSDYIHIDTREVSKRFLYFFDQSAYPELHTYQVRWGRVRTALNAFADSPITGAGLRNPSYLAYGETHNSYASILADTGLLGAIPFLGILFFITRVCLWRIPRRFDRVNWVSLGSRASLVVVLWAPAFIYTYTSPHYWIYLALCLVAVETEPFAPSMKTTQTGS
ncbi:MAG: O-antigen ligase family protein [Elusimicrobia bacterium]|nr:O-antigen ligase family protein [Elusimicrobiota bacterium]